MPPTMVAAARDVPGHKARTWNSPTPRACDKVSVSSECEVRRETIFSAMIIATPPIASAQVTATGVKRCCLIVRWARYPTTSAGTVAMTMRPIPAQPCKFDLVPATAVPRQGSKAMNRCQYRKTTDRMAPNWIATSKLDAFSPTKPSRWPTMIRCPVEDTGINSVKPSTIPIIKGTPQNSTRPPFQTWHLRHGNPLVFVNYEKARDTGDRACAAFAKSVAEKRVECFEGLSMKEHQSVSSILGRSSWTLSKPFSATGNAQGLATKIYSFTRASSLTVIPNCSSKRERFFAFKKTMSGTSAFCQAFPNSSKSRNTFP